MSARLHIRLLGPLAVERDGVPLALPQSKKARALLAYLVSTGRSHRRARLCELLWPDVDDPRGGLRWALSRLRPLLDDPDCVRLNADAQSVWFDARDVEVDATALAQIALEAADTASLIALADRYRGAFLEDLELPELLDVHAFCLAERERLASRQRALLDVLVARHRDRPQEALAFARRRAELAPRDQAVQAALIEQLVAAGKLREAEEHHRAQREWLETRGPERARRSRVGPSTGTSDSSIRPQRPAQ